MKFALNEDKLKKVIEVFLNKELQSLKEWLSGVDELSNLFYEYDESYIKAIERVDKIEVIKLYRHTFQITNDESWRVDIIIYSNVGDFDWDMLTYDLAKKLENLFGVRSIGIVVEDYKWSHKQENED